MKVEVLTWVHFVTKATLKGLGKSKPALLSAAAAKPMAKGRALPSPTASDHIRHLSRASCAHFELTRGSCGSHAGTTAECESRKQNTVCKFCHGRYPAPCRKGTFRLRWLLRDFFVKTVGRDSY